MPRVNKSIDVFRFINTHDNDYDVCWEWTGALGGRDGRGYFALGGKRMLAHRLVYSLVFGDIPDGLVLRHRCDNPICCNPYHLEPGTRGDNENDKYDRDRAGMPLDAVREINRLAKLGMTYPHIAEVVNNKFGLRVTASGVGKVVRGERRLRQREPNGSNTKDTETNT